jgi:hypothetical protein
LGRAIAYKNYEMVTALYINLTRGLVLIHLAYAAETCDTSRILARFWHAGTFADIHMYD